MQATDAKPSTVTVCPCRLWRPSVHSWWGRWERTLINLETGRARRTERFCNSRRRYVNFLRHRQLTTIYFVMSFVLLYWLLFFLETQRLRLTFNRIVNASMSCLNLRGITRNRPMSCVEKLRRWGFLLYLLCNILLWDLQVNVLSIWNNTHL